MLSRRVSRSRWKFLLSSALSLATCSLGLVVTSAPAGADLGSGGRLVVVASGLSQMASGGMRGICVDSSDNLFFANTPQNKIYELTAASVYTQVITVAGSGQSGNLVAGAAISSPMTNPRGLACRPDGSIFFTTAGQVGRLIPTYSGYSLKIIAGTGSSGTLINNGNALVEPLSNPAGLTVTDSGVIYIVDSYANVAYSLTPSGSTYTLKIIAGTGTAGYPTAGPSLNSSLNNPSDIALTPSGSLMISDSNTGFVEQLTSSAQGWTTSIVTQLGSPRGFAVDTNGNVYVAATATNRVYELIPVGKSYSVTLVAGSGVSGSPVAGPATSSPLSAPRFLTLDIHGYLMIGDSGNGAVEAVLPNAAIPPLPPTVSADAITSSGAITFHWSVSNNGGSDITSYTWSGACSGSGNVTSVTCTGLTGGQDYSLVVSATNSAGASDLGAASARALTVPDTPSVSAENITSSGAIIFQWSVANNGGADITSYTWSGACSGTGNVTSVTCIGLTGGISYELDVTATNTLGDSSAGSDTVMGETVPDAPASVSLTAGVGTINVDDIVTSNDGGSPLTSYEVTATDAAGNSFACSVNIDSSQNSPGCQLSGLSNGTTYDVTVIATNALGNSSSLDGGSVTTPDVAAAPEVSASPASLSGQITFTWSAPNNGGADITSYTWSGACSGTGNVTSVTCSGLTGGISYELDVTATNAVGISQVGSNSATARTVPGSVSAISLSAGHGTIDVSWSAPSDDGGNVVSSYTVTATDAAGNTFSCLAGPGISANWTGCTVTGLADATSYDVTVVANNALGASTSTDGGWVDTVAVPRAPSVTTQPVTEGGAITFTWSVANNGGADITSYTWSGACSGSGNVTSVTCTGLTAGTTYQLNVTATNDVGTSEASSAQVTTPAAPSLPRQVTATATLHSVVVTWLPVLDDGGSPLTAYEVSAIGVDLYAHRCVVSANETACTISGLDSGATFVISVMAVNSWDNSLPASGGSIMTWRLPAAPVTVSALSQSRAATLTWSAPNNNGGNPVTSYTVTDGHAHQCVTVLTNCTISNLVNGTAYVFTVTATTRAGTSPVATFASVIPLGTNITQRVAGFGVNSSTISRAMSDQITSVATAIVSSGRRVVTITGYGNVGLPNSIRLARANHARATLLAALAAAGHRDVVVSVAVGPASTTFGVGGPAVLAASRRCVVIATH